MSSDNDGHNKLDFKVGSQVGCKRVVDEIREGLFDNLSPDDALDRLWSTMNQAAKDDGNEGWSPSTIATKTQKAKNIVSTLRPGIFKFNNVRRCWLTALLADPQETSKVITCIAEGSTTAHDKYHKLLVIMTLLINHPYFNEFPNCPHDNNYELAKTLSKTCKQAKDIEENLKEGCISEEDMLFDKVLNNHEFIIDSITNTAFPAATRLSMIMILTLAGWNRCDIHTLAFFIDGPTGYTDAVTDEDVPHVERDTHTGGTVKYPVGHKCFFKGTPDEEGVMKWSVVLIGNKTNEDKDGELVVTANELPSTSKWGALNTEELIKDVIRDRRSAPATYFPNGVGTVGKRTNCLFTNREGCPITKMNQPGAQYGKFVATLFAAEVEKQKIHFPDAKFNKPRIKKNGVQKPGKSPSLTSNNLRKWFARQQSDAFFAAYDKACEQAKEMNHSVEVHKKYYVGPRKKKAKPEEGEDSDSGND